MEPTWKLVFIDDITGIAIYEGSGVRVKAYPGTTHYPVQEPSSGNVLLDAIVLNRLHIDLETGIERISKHTVPWWHTKIIPSKFPVNESAMFDPTVKADYGDKRVTSYEDPDLKSDQEEFDKAIDRSTWYVPVTRR